MLAAKLRSGGQGQRPPVVPFKLRLDVGRSYLPRTREPRGMCKGPVAGEGLKEGWG